MSNIGTEVIVGKMFKPIITTLTYEELEEYRDQGTNIGINNSFIISIPQQKIGNITSDDGDSTSIWMTDESGLLCPLTHPYSHFKEIADILSNYNEINTKKIQSLRWHVNNQSEQILILDSYAGQIPIITNKVDAYYSQTDVRLMSVDEIEVYTDTNMMVKYIPSYDERGNIVNWYDTVGTYYLQGLVKNLDGSYVKTLDPLIWQIKTYEKRTPEIVITERINNHDEHYAEYNIISDIEGVLQITNDTTSEYTITKNGATFTSIYLNENKAVTIKITNNGTSDIQPTLSYIFTPKEYKYFNEVQSTYTVPNIIEGHNTYYWYAGAGPINSSTIPGSDANWHLIEGTPSSIATGELENNTKINWILAVPTKFNLNHISNGEDITDVFDVTIVTCADGIEYKVFTQLAKTRRIDYIFI